jgi:hypothetical protein
LNLTELITWLEAFPEMVKVEELEDYTDYLFYRITYETDDSNIVSQKAITVIVIDRGGAGETAYVKEGVPSFIKDDTFRQEVITAVALVQAGNPDLEYYKIDFCDEVNEVAKITGYLWNSAQSIVEEVSYISYKVDTNIMFRKIGVAT